LAWRSRLARRAPLLVRVEVEHALALGHLEWANEAEPLV
jgi:hypothetical protein